MEPISEKLVETTWQEFASFSPLRAQKETIEVNKNQPYLLTFMVEFTRDLDQRVKELAVYMFYVVCRMFQKSSRKKIKTISPEEVISCYEKNERLVESLEGAHEKFWERIAEVQLSAQPYVMKYVIETLLETSEEEFSIALSEEDTGYLYLLLKTVVDLLDQALRSGPERSKNGQESEGF